MAEAKDTIKTGDSPERVALDLTKLILQAGWDTADEVLEIYKKAAAPVKSVSEGEKKP